MNQKAKSIMTMFGLGFLISAALLILVAIWFDGKEPNLLIRIPETFFASFGVAVGWGLIWNQLPSLKKESFKRVLGGVPDG